MTLGEVLGGLLVVCSLFNFLFMQLVLEVRIFAGICIWDGTGHIISLYILTYKSLDSVIKYLVKVCVEVCHATR